MAPRGNRNAVRHGAHARPSPAKTKAMREALYATLAAAAPVREGDAVPPADDAAVRLCALTLCRLAEVSEWLDHEGVIDERGRFRSAATAERRLISAANKQLAALGMTPAARARIGVDVAQVVDLATALSEPNEHKRAELMRQAGLELGPGA